MSDIVLKNVDPPKDDDILVVDVYSDGKARCYSWSEKWIDVVVIDGKPLTNADRIRSMTDEEIEEWYWWMHKEMMRYTDSRIFVHDWLKSPVEVE